MEILQYPFDGTAIIQKRRSIRRELLKDGSQRIKKNIAILGGSTTAHVINTLELFLLDNGIEPTFYQSEYAQYRNDILFDNPKLDEFHPDIIYFHTDNRNLTEYTFNLNVSYKDINDSIQREYENYSTMWDIAFKKYDCPIIQNNFEKPYYRILGNRDCYDYHGMGYYIEQMNARVYEYARLHKNFYINDIDYLSSDYGLSKWCDTSYWHMYKYFLCLDAIPELAYSICNIIKSIYGKNKKALILDLDNTLWGGVIGDDGQEGIEIGQETFLGQVYSEFQTYLKDLSKIGILLTIDSKNEYENAILGLEHPDNILKPNDFVSIKANWSPKNENAVAISNELNILPDSFVFIDDNPAEREIVKQNIKGISIPDIGEPQDYIRRLDRCGYFEVTSLSKDDIDRSNMYRENAQRNAQRLLYTNYDEYLKSLEMVATIGDFLPMYIPRITQLTNKSNQFNLTTKRYTQSEIERLTNDESYIRLYARLSDRFGDNGIVSVVIGKTVDDILHIELWLMSCRVLKRTLEYTLLEKLIEACRYRNIRTIKGYYYKTAKNSIVKDLYKEFGFSLESTDENDNSIWFLDVDTFVQRPSTITVIDNRR